MELPKLLMEIGQTIKFKDDPVDDALIGDILDAATHAPSAGNIQPWRFIVVKDNSLKERLSDAALRQNFIKDAPAVIVVCGDTERAFGKYSARGEKLYMIQDTAYASLLILMACKTLGLGCYLVRSFDEDSVSEILEIHEHIRPVTIIPIGYPAAGEEKKSRMPFEEVTFLDRCGSKYQERTRTLEEVFRGIARRRKK